jgi:hypothetical protein
MLDLLNRVCSSGFVAQILQCQGKGFETVGKDK